MSQDHFSTNLGETDGTDDSSTEIHGDGVTDVQASEEPKKRKIPSKLVMAAVVAVGVVGFWGFKKFNAPLGSPDTTQPQEQHPTRVEGGMLGAGQPQNADPQQSPTFLPPEQPVTSPAANLAAREGGTFSGPGRAPAQGTDADKTAGEFAAAGEGASSPAAQINPTKPQSTSMPSTSSAQAAGENSDSSALLQALNAKLDTLANRLAAIENRGQNERKVAAVAAAEKQKRSVKVSSAADRVREHASGVLRGKPSKRSSEPRDETVVGYKIKQVIPGQAWLEDENGKQVVKVKGDKLGGSEIVEIDADRYVVRTTAGVIR